MEFKPTERGFRKFEFEDRYDKACSLQKSSLAFEDAIWFGINDPEPQIMAHDAIKLGLEELVEHQPPQVRGTGWVPFPVPAEVSMTNRMHLTREQVSDLLPLLIHFVDTGALPDPDEISERQKDLFNHMEWEEGQFHYDEDEDEEEED